MQKRAAIIGSGISGLSCAYFLNKRGWAVEIFDAREQAGGLISSIETKHGLVETAANGFLNSVLLESVAGDIGCRLQSTRKESRARFVARDGHARQWPLSIFETLKLIAAVGRYFLARASMAPRKLESLREWGARVLGASVSRYTIETAVQGVYAMSTDEQSATLTLKRFFAVGERAPQPSVRGTVAPKKGMGEFAARLEAALTARGVIFHFKKRLAELPEGFDAVVVATSAADAALLLKNDERAGALAAIEMQGLISATVFFSDKAKALEGFGCLFPQGEGHFALGVLMNGFIFENRVSPGVLSETWIFKFGEFSDETLLAQIQDERAKLGWPKAPPLSSQITRWPKALPRYDRSLETRLPQLLARSSRTQPYLVGNYLGEIGLKNLLARAEVTAASIDKDYL